MRALYKTTIVIWTDYPADESIDLEQLARNAVCGDAYCSKQECVKVEDPEADPAWDNTEFFDEPEDEADLMAEGDECPNCHCGTIEETDDEFRCRGECGSVFRKEKR